MSRRDPPYLTRRGDVFWFRMAVPRNLVSRIGLREIKISLATRNRQVARSLCLQLGGGVLQLIAKFQKMTPLPPERIRQLAATYLAAQRDQIRDLALRLPNDSAIDCEFEGNNALDEMAALRKQLNARPFDPVTLSAASSALDEAKIDKQSISPSAFNALCVGILRARIEGLRIYAATLQGRFHECEPIDPLFAQESSDSLLAGAKPAAPASPCPTVGELAAIYCERHSGTRWSDKTSDDNRCILELFC